jgi:hypothetical protein
MRHRVSTLYAGTDVPEADRQYFYKHMGHSASINANIYQAPLAESEILKVGRHLITMDGGQNVLSSRGENSDALTNNVSIKIVGVRVNNLIHGSNSKVKQLIQTSPRLRLTIMMMSKMLSLRPVIKSRKRNKNSISKQDELEK